MVGAWGARAAKAERRRKNTPEGCLASRYKQRDYAGAKLIVYGGVSERDGESIHSETWFGLNLIASVLIIDWI